MPYRKRRYAKKQFRRRKTFRRKKMMGRRSKADKGYLEKIQIHASLNVDAGGNFAQFQANWMATGAAGANETFFTGSGANVNPQFAQCAGMFREYFVSSLKIQYRPNMLDAGNAGSFSIAPIDCGSVMDRLIAYPIPIGEYYGSLDFKTYDPKRPFTRFYRVAKYANTKLIKYRSCTDAIAGAGGAGGFNVLPNAQTVLHTATAGLAAGTSLGTVEVTYYIRFRFRTRT